MIKFENYLLENDKLEKSLINKVKNNPPYIMNIKNPNEKIQLAAVKNDPTSIRFISNPTERVQIVVVNSDGTLIKLIKNPSNKVQLAAVKEFGYIIRQIKNPSQEVQLNALISVKNIDGFVNASQLFYLNIFNKKDFQLQIKLINSDANFIQIIENPNKNIQKLALDKNPYLLIKYPDKFDLSVAKKYKHLILPDKIGIFDD